MSSPSPQKKETKYQSIETTNIGHLSSTWSEKKLTSTPKNERNQVGPENLQGTHSVQVESPIHGTNELHNHSPKISPKRTENVCKCYNQQDVGNNENYAKEDQKRKMELDKIEVSPVPPALPPRPPFRPRYEEIFRSMYDLKSSNLSGSGIRKYVFWCCACGGLATILGASFLAVYFLVRSYTSTLSYFETIPTFVPATMLILTGICVMSLSRRKNRYSYLIKVCGLCCLVCALTCVLVTITTTVIHMNRLQTLRECVYTAKTRTCTCYSVILEAHANADEGMRYVFDSTPDCEVIHGALYICLRAMFGLSVSGILVCIFSSMLVYQLLSHEKKKMYWEQLEMRSRAFYHQHSGAHSNHGSVRGPPVPPSSHCSCCVECRYSSVTPGPQVYPWDNNVTPTDRFWASCSIGNFYSPNPEDGANNVVPEDNVRVRPSTGWNWRRLPWSRNSAEQQSYPSRNNSLTCRGMVGSNDSQYGFSNRSTTDNAMQDQLTVSGGSYSVLDNRPPVGGLYVWGPPPPYSNPNSPARRLMNSSGRYHHIHHHNHGHECHCQPNENIQVQQSSRRRPNFNDKDNYENTTEPEIHHSSHTNESTDTSSCVDRISHTLPTKKMKKRVDMSSVKSNIQPNARGNVQNLFNQVEQEDNKAKAHHEYQEAADGDNKSSDNSKCWFLPRLQGVENAAFHTQENSLQKPEPSESEVYFADVSSCCNISVRNDGQDSSLYDEALESQKSRLTSFQKADPTDVNTSQLLQTFQENISSSTVTEDEDCLAHRMGNRQMSIRRSEMEFNGNSCLQLLPKDISQNSLCSSVQTPLTETTDDTMSPDECSHFQETSCEHPLNHRILSFNSEHYLAPDAQYEVIPNQENYKNSPNNISNINYDQNYNKNKLNFDSNVPGTKNIPPKSLNLNQPPRKNFGSNISALINDLEESTAGLLYEDANNKVVKGQLSYKDRSLDSC